MLRLAASVEQASEHPLAAAIVAAAKERSIALAKVTGFDSPTGKGAIGMVERRRVVLGNAKFLAELNIATAPLDARAEELRRDGATAIFVAIDGKAAGVIAIADPIKPSTPEALDGAARRRHPRRDADRRQPHHRAGGRAQARHHARSKPRCCRIRRAP